MNVPPILLLSIGCIFALGYALFITIGWAITRRNRKIYQKVHITHLPLFDLETGKICDDSRPVKVISLSGNSFVSVSGDEIDLTQFKAYIAKGESDKFPAIKTGNLLLLNSSGEIIYAFDIPDISQYR